MQNCKNTGIRSSDYSCMSSTDSYSSEDEHITDNNVTKAKENLELRFRKLKGKMSTLTAQLTEERTLWKNEVEQVKKILQTTNKSECGCHGSSKVSFEIMGSDFKLTPELSASGCQLRPGKSGDIFVKKQLEKKERLKRQLAINNYKKKLLEVENLCNLELLRVKQSVEFLQPLQMIVFEWNTDKINESINTDDKNDSSNQPEQSDMDKEYQNLK